MLRYICVCKPDITENECRMYSEKASSVITILSNGVVLVSTGV